MRALESARADPVRVLPEDPASSDPTRSFARQPIRGCGRLGTRPRCSQACVMPRSLLLVISLGLLLVFPGGAQAREGRPLGEVLDTLARSGVPVFWSSSLADEVIVDVSQPATPREIAAALEETPVTLEQQGDRWILRPRTVQTGQAPAEVVAPQAIEQVIVTGSRREFARDTFVGGVRALDTRSIRDQPAFGSDPLRVLNRLPGMASIGISARPRVRGGLPDELLIRIDGVELFDPYHLADFQGLFSAIDDRAVDAITLYDAGFPARYGNRMSGVLDMRTPDVDASSTEVGVSSIALFGNTRGVSRDGRTQWLLSGRRGDLDRLSRNLGPRVGSPDFHDAFARLRHSRGDASFDLGVLQAADDVRLVDDEETANSRVDSRYLWLSGAHGRPSSGQLDWRLAYTDLSRARNKRNVDDASDADARGSLSASSDIRRLVFAIDLRRSFGAVLLESGGRLAWSEARFDTESDITRLGVANLLAPAVETTIGPVRRSASGPSLGAYVSAQIPLTDRLVLQPGLRWDRRDLGRPEGVQDHLAPRIGLRWRPNPALELSTSIGRYHQFEALEAVQLGDGVTTLQQPQRADHVVATLRWSAARRLDLRLDAWAKRYGRTRFRYENLFTSFVFLPEIEPDRVVLAPDRARAHGFEAELSWRPVNAAQLALRYGYMDTDDRIAGQWVPRRWAQRDTVQASASYERGRLSLSAALTWNSGWRTSAPPEFVAAGEPLELASILNNQRLRDYLSLDVAARWSVPIGAMELNLFADVSNALDRSNVAGIDHEFEPEDGGFTFLPEREQALPLLYTVGASVRF